MLSAIDGKGVLNRDIPETTSQMHVFLSIWKPTKERNKEMAASAGKPYD